jgi:hypothetical protein
MILDDFDAPEQVAIATRDQLEAEQTDKMIATRSVRDRVVSPEVAKALREGWTFREIGEALGVSPQTVAKHVRSADMSTLIDREARRVLRHLVHRNLKDEKYRDLALAMGVLVDKARLLRNEPTEITENRTTGGVDRLAVLLFGPTGGSGGGNQIIDVTPQQGSRSVSNLLESAESSGQEEISGSDVRSLEPGVPEVD